MHLLLPLPRLGLAHHHQPRRRRRGSAALPEVPQRHLLRSLDERISRHCPRRLLVYLTFFIICTYIYLTNYAYFCRASHTPRGATRMLIFASPALEGNHKIEREGFLGEFWVAAEDLYLSHVVCSTIESFRPTHVVVLGTPSSFLTLRRLARSDT